MVSSALVRSENKACFDIRRWHILTAWGVYCYIDLVEELRDRHLGQQVHGCGKEREMAEIRL
jgi:hypothetical protein